MHRRGLAAGERWVIEGGYPEVVEVALPLAQLAVLLDLPRRVTLPRLLLRPLRRRDRDRGDLPRGLRHVVDRDNLSWAWHWPVRERSGALEALAAHAAEGGETAVLRSAAEVRRWLAAAARGGERS